MEKYGAYEGLAESLMNFWESSYQQENILNRKSMGDKNFNMFEINELYVFVGITRDKSYKVSPEVNEETKGEYPCILDIDQIQKSFLGLKNEMTWSRGDKKKRTLAYVDSGVADREGKKFVMTQEETILSQRGDQYLKEFAVGKMVNEDKAIFSNLRKYDEELEMLEDWLINPRIDNDDCLMHVSMKILNDNIGKEKIAGKTLNYFII